MASNSRLGRTAQIPSWRQVTAQLHNVPRALKFVWVTAPGWLIVSMVLLVVQGILPVLTVYLTRTVVNATVIMVQSGVDQSTLVPVVAVVLAFGLVLLAIELLGSVDRYVQAVLGDRTQDYVHQVIQAKAIVLDLRYFESPEYYDQLRRASVDALGRPMGLLQNLSNLLQNSITLVAMAGVLFSFVWWMPFVLLLGTAPALWVALRAAVHFHAWRRRATVDQRRLYYYHYVLTSSEFAPEVRLFALGKHVSGAYRRLSAQLRGEQVALARQQMWGQIVAGVFGCCSACWPPFCGWHGRRSRACLVWAI
ncbi:MAG: ABC transporter ATP-binding protein [Anaerolineales bacterium]|nr:ABC transporter ATP-binding protein [Anaerolineales bacterium]